MVRGRGELLKSPPHLQALAASLNQTASPRHWMIDKARPIRDLSDQNLTPGCISPFSNLPRTASYSPSPVNFAMAGCFCRCVTVLFGTILFSVLAMQSLRDLHQCHYAATVISHYYPLEGVKEGEVKSCSTTEVIVNSVLLAGNLLSAVGLLLTVCLEKKALFVPAIIFTVRARYF